MKALLRTFLLLTCSRSWTLLLESYLVVIRTPIAFFLICFVIVNNFLVLEITLIRVDLFQAVLRAQEKLLGLTI